MIQRPLLQDLDKAVDRALSSANPHTRSAAWARRWLYRIDRTIEAANVIARLGDEPLHLAARACVAWSRAQGLEGQDRDLLMAEAESLVSSLLV